MVQWTQGKVVVGMAKNYTPKELFDVIVDGNDIDALTDIGRRYPLLSVKLAKLCTVSDQVADVLGALPGYLTARKLEKTLRGGASEAVDEAEATDEADEAEAEPEEEKPAPKKRGRKPKAVVEAEPEAEPEVTEGGKYDGIPAPKLFQECKKRGIKAAPKKPAEFYIKLLEEADASGSNTEDDGDEDWDI